MHEIRLYDEIGGWGTTAAEFADSIPKDADAITVRINTPGGAVGDGLAIYHYLKDHAAHVTTIVDGYAASMGSIVALAGDVRQVHKASMFMVHQPWGCECGNADQMRKRAEGLDVHTEALLDIYEDATGMDRVELKALLDGETWMRGEAAIEYGFATELIEANDESNKQAAAHGAFASMVSALTEGRELMSKQKTRKELEAELVAKGEEVAEVEAKVEEIKAESDAKVEEVEAEAVAKVAEAEVATEIVSVERDEIAARLEVAEANALELRGLVDGIRAELDAAKAEVDAKAEEVAKAKAALKNPAVADAVIQDVTPEAKTEVDAEADEAEAKALADAESGEVDVAPHYAKYRELMEAGEARKARSYWKANEADIAKEQKALIAAEEEQG